MGFVGSSLNVVKPITPLLWVKQTQRSLGFVMSEGRPTAGERDSMCFWFFGARIAKFFGFLER